MIEYNIFMEENKFEKAITKARQVYPLQGIINCPYLGPVTLTSEGFNHLQNKRNKEPRNISEQILKLNLLPKALEVIKKSGTLQEYRVQLEKFGGKGKDVLSKTKRVEYWGFHSIFGEQKDKKIVVVIRRVGDGKITFWSVLPHRKFNNQKLYDDGIDED
jgi:hypothetical protein